MNNITRAILSAAAALGVAGSAEAQYANGDLLVGFSGGANDFIMDLGSYASMTPGETWTVGANLGTEFGVVGALNSGQLIYATSGNSSESGFNPAGLFQAARANVYTLDQGGLVAGASASLNPALTYSWTYQTAQPGGTAGNTFENNFFNPNVSVGQTAYLFANANGGAVTPLDEFTYNGNSGQLTVQTVPEPGTVTLLAVAGLAGWVWRRRLGGRGR